MAKSHSSLRLINSARSSQSVRSGAAFVNEKRRGELAVPLNLRSLLSSEQLVSVQQMEGFGWRLAFVRRHLESDPTVVVNNARQRCFALLKKDGSIDTVSPIRVRL